MNDVSSHNMRRQLLILMLMVVEVTAMAVPARRGQWTTVTLTDGTTVRVELRGDEHLHYFVDSLGQRYVASNMTGRYERATAATMATLQRRAIRRRQVTELRQAQRRQAMRRQTAFTGKKKGLVLLVDFRYKQFQTKYDSALFHRMLNEEGFSDYKAQGSVADYFRDQSDGRFQLSFDVVGPIRMSGQSADYGGTAQDGNDERVDKLVKEACQKVDSYVNFKDYDWDGDGEVEQVFIIYAGRGQADGGTVSTIWPHQWNLSSYNNGSAITLDGVKIDTYACAPELDGNDALCGIGTICHEFSHCLGFPDLYDTGTTNNFGMGHFDLMSSGNYNKDGHLPPCYTSWERWTAGWLTPTELTDSTVDVTDLEPLCKNGGAYIIYNEGNRDEYYLLENRQQQGWDAGLFDAGLLIMHVDYDKELFDANIVNTELSDAEASSYEVSKGNDHQRMTIFHAGGGTMTGDYNYATEIHDLYPYNKNNSLTKTSSPAATVYNANSDGSFYMNRSVTDIRQNNDGTMAFRFTIDKAESGGGDQPDITAKGDTLLYETFDQCVGTGGNDGKFSGTGVANKAFWPDLEDWTVFKAYGGDRCAKFGTTRYNGLGTTPSFTMPGDTLLLTFRAACWNSDNDKTSLQINLDDADGQTSGIVRADGTLHDDDQLTMQRGAWTSYTVTLVGSMKGATVTFYGDKRFFLDDVLIMRTHHMPDQAALDIRGITVHPHVDGRQRQGVYSIDGRYLGTSTVGLLPGVYIVDGKKVVF